MASDMTLYSSTSYPQAMSMSVLDVERFFKGKSFEIWKKNREAESGMQEAIVKRLDAVITGIGALAKKR